jgi:putative hemolysin
LTAEFLFIILLSVANGIFAMSEAAMISSRRARLQQRAENGDAGAAAALKLSEKPDRFLSTVQIGITLIGILSGAVGGSTLAKSVEPAIAAIPALATRAEAISVFLVVLLITYLSLVIGELVPKTLALNNAEGIASLVARPMQVLSTLASPIVSLLSLSTRVVLLVLGVRPSDEPPVTEEEVRIMLEQGAEAGVFATSEQQMLENVFRLGDWRTSAVMTPYTEVEWVDLDAPIEETIQLISNSRYFAYPVFQGDHRNLLGVVLLEDLWVQLANGKPLDVKAAIKTPLVIPENAPATSALEQFRITGQRLALVMDEHGSISGVITPQDILEAVLGEAPAETEARMSQRADGSWLVDGMLHIDEVEDLLDDKTLFPEDERGDYQTLGGFVMMRIGRIPQPADQFEWNGMRFEVMDMDGRRVDKILISRLNKPTEEKADA